MDVVVVVVVCLFVFVLFCVLLFVFVFVCLFLTQISCLRLLLHTTGSDICCCAFVTSFEH